MNIEEMSLEEIQMAIANSDTVDGIPPIELLIAFNKKYDELDEAQGVPFNISVLNSNNEEVDKIKVKSRNVSIALLKAEAIFLEKHPNYKLTDSGMLLGSNSRDLCVEINDEGTTEDFELIISK